jgi:MSHA biogenesis protein MshJ
VNEQLKKALDSMIRNLESRKQSERLMILGLLMAGIGMIYLSVAYDPLRANIDNITSRIASVERQIQAQQSSYQEMLRQSQEDPNRFINDRLIVLQREQVELDRQIQALAGDLVTPNQMTEILTTVLERQQGLELVSFQNIAAEPLREGASDAGQILAETGALNFSDVDEDEVVGQVYSHGLVIEFEGDYFSTLKYLRFLEEITGSFFWDAISFRQLEWPIAHVTLEIHTLSTDQGFIGV